MKKENKEVVAALDPLVRELESKMAEHVKALRDKYPLFPRHSTLSPWKCLGQH